MPWRFHNRWLGKIKWPRSLYLRLLAAGITIALKIVVQNLVWVRSAEFIDAAEQPWLVEVRGAAARIFSLMMTNFGFQPGILDFWMLLSDWQNGSFIILLALGLLLLGYSALSRQL
jgi:hypothetical protein